MQASTQSSNPHIRWCSEEEIDWVNEQYEKLDFKPSSLVTDRIAVAIFGGERVGLGRLCRIEDSFFELGGMHVQPIFRGYGIARKIVKFLLSHRDPKATVYCLPFAHLRDFYESEGFEEVSEEVLSKVPRDILKKHHWCNENYPYGVLLLEFRSQK